jgi:hypothetical protein
VEVVVVHLGKQVLLGLTVVLVVQVLSLSVISLLLHLHIQSLAVQQQRLAHTPLELSQHQEVW